MSTLGSAPLNPQQQQPQQLTNVNQLPQNNGSARLRSLLARAQELQAAGAKEGTNAEFAQIMQLLRNLQRNQSVTGQQPMQQQQQQQQSQQQQPQQQQQQQQQHYQQATIANGVHPQQAFAQQSQAASQQQSNAPAYQATSSSQFSGRVAGVPSQHSVPTTPQSTVPQSPFTPKQLQTLKDQIIAFRNLQKNLPLSEEFKQAVFNPSGSSSLKDASQAVPRKIVESAYAHHAAGGMPSTTPQMDTSQPVVYNDYTSPYTFLRKNISSFNHSSRQQRVLVPSLTPTGLDPYMLAEERENRVRARINDRINELEETKSNLANTGLTVDEWSDMEDKKENYNVVTPTGPKLKALIELRALRLLDRQKKLREEIVAGMNRATVLATSVDRASYRRMKKQSMREARMTEKLERQQRMDREKREKQKHLDYLQSIVNHGRELIQFQRNHQAKQAKLGKAVMQFHNHVEKEEQKRAERNAKQRLQALKDDDEEAYLKLIDEAKDTRITHLLKSTNLYLESLAKAVVDQQNSYEVDGPSLDMGPMDEDDTQLEGADGKKIDYMQIAHKVKESVAQPAILVGGKLKEYQLKGLQWMVSLYNNRLNGILADEMGLGKTIQTISLIAYLIESKHQNGPFLIVVPLSTLTNWTLEFEKWAPSITCVVYKGSPQARKFIQQNEIRHGNFQVLMTTYEYVIKDRYVLSKIKWVHAIIDEGHRMKNTQSKLSMMLTQHYNTRYRLILTGTPLQNNLHELWSLLNFILPKIFNSVKTFQEWFNTPFSSQGGADDIKLNEEEALLIIKRLHKVLRPFLLRRLKKDVEAELPDKIEKVIKCKMSALQIKLYKQMQNRKSLFTTSQHEKGKAGVKGFNNMVMQFRKICNHPFVFEEIEHALNPRREATEDLLYRVAGKFELLDRMLPKLKRTGHRVLMFFQMTQIMTIMEDFLKFRHLNYLRLDGATKADQRSDLLRIFNAEGSPHDVFLLSTRAGGLGLNLQSADTVIIFDSDWNPHQDLQAQDRAHRIGQKKEVRIFRLITEKSVEEKILEKAQKKLDMDGKVIQAGKFDNRSTDEDREQFLRSLLEDKPDDDEDKGEDDDFDDEELNMILKRNDQEYAIFTQMDKERERQEEEDWRASGNRSKRPGRLIEEWELPEIYRNEELWYPQEDEVELGKGTRKRAEVRYDDGLTEEQFMNTLEDENLDLHEVIAQNAERKARREAKKVAKFAKQLNDDFSNDDDDSHKPKKRGRPKREESVASTDIGDMKTPVKKRGRPRKADYDGDTPDFGSARKRRKKEDMELMAPDTLHPNIRKELTRIFFECYKAVEDCTEEIEGEYRERCYLFRELPSKKQYPDYYIMIQKPIAMDIIKRRIQSPYYKNINMFRDDWYLMFDNARTYNVEGSMVYTDANEMQRVFDAMLNELCPGGILPASIMAGHDMSMPEPSLDMHKQTPVDSEEDDDEDNDDGDPLQSQGLTKIKLKMNSGTFGKKQKRIHDEDDEEEDS